MSREHFCEYHLARLPGRVNGCKSSDFPQNSLQSTEDEEQQGFVIRQRTTYLPIYNIFAVNYLNKSSSHFILGSLHDLLKAKPVPGFLVSQAALKPVPGQRLKGCILLFPHGGGDVHPLKPAPSFSLSFPFHSFPKGGSRKPHSRFPFPSTE